MGTIYGVTPQGFVVKPLDQCLTELEALARGTFGDGIKLNPSSKWGQFLGILAERESEIWDMGEEVHASRDPDQATGTGLEALCALTGLERNGAAKSTVPVILGGVVGTVIPAGKVASVTGTGTRFVLTAQATIGPGGSVGATFEAEATGPFPAPAGALTTIETPVAGWATITNAVDATLGRDVELDPALRLRREQTLAIAGSATEAAVTAEVARVDGVVAAATYINDEDVVVDGMEPHSMEVVVAGGTDAAVAAAIWRAKAGGIKSLGSTAVVVQDSAGANKTVRFSRPEPVLAYLRVTVSINDGYSTSEPPLDGDTLVKNALAAWAAANIIAGETLYPRAMLPAVFGVAGVYNVPLIAAGLAADPVAEVPVVATKRQVVQVDATRISVVHG
jgi:uncharacterized phage protein gp47/JayE